jgi:hypothetical protein
MTWGLHSSAGLRLPAQPWTEVLVFPVLPHREADRQRRTERRPAREAAVRPRQFSYAGKRLGFCAPATGFFPDRFPVDRFVIDGPRRALAAPRRRPRA